MQKFSQIMQRRKKAFILMRLFLSLLTDAHIAKCSKKEYTSILLSREISHDKD